MYINFSLRDVLATDDAQYLEEAAANRMKI